MPFPDYPALIVNDEYRKRRKRLAKDSVPSYDSGARYCPDCGGSIYYLRHPEFVSYLRRTVGDEEPPHYWCYYCPHFFQHAEQLRDHAQLMERRKAHQ